MEKEERGLSLQSRLGAKRRTPVSLSQNALVRSEVLLPKYGAPLVFYPAIDGVNLVTWATSNRELILDNLLKYKALLFRNFNEKEVAGFERFMNEIVGELIEYSYRSTPRSKVEGNVYTSTEYSVDQHIPQHNEMSYSRQWPMKIGFFCIKAAEQGGETPIADSQRVFERIDPQVREKFMQKKVMYVRNYSEGLDIPWQTVFQTTDKAAVEAFCQNVEIETEWKADGGLRTRQVCQAVVTHPTTKQVVWFNQAHLFHISNLTQEASSALLSTFKEEDLPRNSYYGDGSPIEDSALAVIRESYQQETLLFPWQEGDIMLLDNVLMSHGRTPFSGQRRVVVGMAEPFSDN